MVNIYPGESKPIDARISFQIHQGEIFDILDDMSQRIILDCIVLACFSLDLLYKSWNAL